MIIQMDWTKYRNNLFMSNNNVNWTTSLVFFSISWRNFQSWFIYWSFCVWLGSIYGLMRFNSKTIENNAWRVFNSGRYIITS